MHMVTFIVCISGSFFSKSKLDLQKWLILIYWWAREYPVGDAAQECGCHKDTAVDVYQWLREVCSTYLCAQPVILGGPGVVVQIDESQFTHKPKVCSVHMVTDCDLCFIDLQHHRGRPPTEEIWVFGMVDTSHTPALGNYTVYTQVV